MTENKRFQWVYIKDNILELRDNGIVKVFNNERLEELLNELNDENEQLKQKMGDLLYQIGEAGKNNKTCRECECFIPEHNICWMWDMEVEADDVVVACDQRKVKNTNGMMSDG